MTGLLVSSGSVAADESNVTPGLLGFVVVALLGVATYFLIRSMTRQINRIDLPDEPGEGAEHGEGGEDGEDSAGRSDRDGSTRDRNGPG